MKLFVATSLRDQIRKARRCGISMDTVPMPSSYDEEGEYDVDADIRMGRFDRAEYHQHMSETKSTIDVSVASSNADVLNPSAPAPVSINEAPTPAAPGAPAPGV